jgi:transcriptional regulator with XRE-family HTH domain
MTETPASYPKFVANLKRLRERRGLTQAQLAEQARLDRTYVIMLERGKKTNPSLGALDRIAEALGVTVIDLLR